MGEPLFKDSEFTPQRIDNGIRRATNGIAQNLATIIAAMTIVTLIMVIFTDVTIGNVFSAKFATEMILLLMLYYCMFLSMMNNGIRDGKSDPEYSELRNCYLSIVNEIRNNHMIKSLCKWCEEYSERELEESKRKILYGVGIPYEEFQEKYADSDRAQLKQLGGVRYRAIRRAQRLKPIHLQADMLLYDGRTGRGRNPITTSPAKKLAIRTLISMLPKTLVAFFTVSIVIDVVAEPTLATFAYGAVKLLTILFVGVNGYTQGLENIAVDSAAYINCRINLLTEYMSEQKNKTK